MGGGFERRARTGNEKSVSLSLREYKYIWCSLVGAVRGLLKISAPITPVRSGGVKRIRKKRALSHSRTQIHAPAPCVGRCVHATNSSDPNISLCESGIFRSSHSLKIPFFLCARANKWKVFKFRPRQSPEIKRWNESGADARCQSRLRNANFVFCLVAFPPFGFEM